METGISNFWRAQLQAGHQERGSASLTDRVVLDGERFWANLVMPKYLSTPDKEQLSRLVASPQGAMRVLEFIANNLSQSAIRSDIENGGRLTQAIKVLRNEAPNDPFATPAAAVKAISEIAKALNGSAIPADELFSHTLGQIASTLGTALENPSKEVQTHPRRGGFLGAIINFGPTIINFGPGA